MAMTNAQKQELAELLRSTVPYDLIDANQSGSTLAAFKPQAAAIADVVITYSANDPAITGDRAVTVADGAVPTVSELLELCEEILQNQNAIIDALQAAGLMA